MRSVVVMRATSSLSRADQGHQLSQDCRVGVDDDTERVIEQRVTAAEDLHALAEQFVDRALADDPELKKLWCDADDRQL
ncbi:hypothetical protein CFP71_28070 [Amycolatopsis thailandensis]|uniref:Uncharacterized protein n=2 Tax=Amycolatopsis thailandensis TaxID=589330 RepID=A0A229RUG0_9PSEU|nr:hypothetical protein CFP71_28070 [Amycolatopsis thailandensis]